jgi:vacuolar-type H+-ATPase subunit E/Vma4
MESEEKGKAALIASIEADAQAEEENIISQAEEQAAEKRQYAQKQVQSILDDARQKANEQTEIIKRKILSDIETEIKRSLLQEQNKIMQDVVDRVEKKMYLMIDEPGYRDILINWITEAAIGLDVESSRINASGKERSLIDERLLAEVMENVKNNGGKTMELTLSEEPPLEYQGVVLTAANGRVAFNNQVKTILSRNQRKIRMMIYNSLFSDTQEV